MPTIISSNNCLSAWQNASQHILQNGGSASNIIVEVENPCDFTDFDKWVIDRNPKSVVPTSDNIRHVINTIFPYGLAGFFTNRNDFYSCYKEIYVKSNSTSWGTYFQRLISFDKHFRTSATNQLEAAINALNGNSPQRNYIVFHLSASHIDSNTRPMGAPCWHFGEITINDDRSLNLVAVYRAQYYFSKAFGNYLGLSKLLEFICKETGRTPGKLVVHAIHAVNDNNRRNLSQLIK